jgi:hypothetical protein
MKIIKLSYHSFPIWQIGGHVEVESKMRGKEMITVYEMHVISRN